MNKYEIEYNVRKISCNGNMFFCAKDITNILGYKNSAYAIKNYCKDAIKRRYQGRLMTFISKRDVFSLCGMKSVFIADKVEKAIF